MSKVIQKINFELHRGRGDKSSDPYSYRTNFLTKLRGLRARCSSTSKVNSISRFDNNIRFNSHARLIGASSAILLLSLLTLTVLPVVHNDDSADAATGTATQSSTTVSVSTATASVDLTATSTDGTFATSTGSGIASFDVTTTNYTGYTLTIEADDDDGTLTNGSGGTFTSISSVMDEKTFDDSTYNGKWGYKPSKMNGVENVGFWPSPTTTATTLDTTKVANTTANTYTIALGARASASQAAGTYSKTVTITATSNPANYSITYKDDTSDSTVKNIPDATTSTTSGTSITLSSVTPSRTGYVFAGWCTATTTSSGTACPGTTYPVGGTYGIDQTTTNTVTLHAIWSVPTYTITLKPTTGVASVKISGNGVNYTCSNTSGCAVTTALTYGLSYTITATMSDGYDFAAWSPSGAGTIASITSSSTTFTVGEGETTISAVASGAAAQAVTVNFAAAGSGTVGISNVTFTETATGTTVGTVSTSGGTVKLEPGVGYTVTANTSGVYSASNYNNGTGPFAINNSSYGALASSSSNTTYFTPNSSSSNAVITVTSCIKTIGSATTNMQDFTTNINYFCDNATGSLKDSRDGQVYTVGIVTANNGGAARTLWMTRNLAIGCSGSGTTYGSTRTTRSLDNSNSNVTTTWSTGSAYNLDKSSTQYTSDTTCSSSSTSGCNSYTQPRMECSATTGAWYNYAAASAGTIAAASSTDYGSYSICPSGWTMPSHSQIAAAASNKAAFSPVAGGYYSGGTLSNTGSGYWWSGNTNGGTNRWYLGYLSSYLYTDYLSRVGGFYVRCVRS